MIKILIVCIIIQCLSHSAVPAAVSQFTIPSTKQALAEHLGDSLAAKHKVPTTFHLCFKSEREVTRGQRDCAS